MLFNNRMCYKWKYHLVLAILQFQSFTTLNTASSSIGTASSVSKDPVSTTELPGIEYSSRHQSTNQTSTETTTVSTPLNYLDEGTAGCENQPQAASGRVSETMVSSTTSLFDMDKGAPNFEDQTPSWTTVLSTMEVSSKMSKTNSSEDQTFNQPEEHLNTWHFKVENITPAQNTSPQDALKCGKGHEKSSKHSNNTPAQENEESLKSAVIYDTNSSAASNISNMTTPISDQSGSWELLSEESFDKFNNVVGNIWIPLCCIGIICNILNVLVFMDRKMRNATSYYLSAISFLQVSYILISLVTKVHQLIYGEIGQRETKFYYQAVIYINNYAGVALSRAVNCLVMLVAMERMMAISFPMRRSRSRLVKSPGICIVCLIILLFTFHAYSLLKFYVYEKETASGKKTYGLNRGKYDVGTINAFSMAGNILFIYLPLLGILIFNIVLCVALKRHSHSRKNLQDGNEVNRRESRDRQTTIAILVSTCIYFLLTVPIPTNSIISNAWSSYNYFSPIYRYTFLFVQLLGTLLGLISYFTDFLTYVIMSSRFRHTLIRKCVPCILTTKMRDQISESSTKKESMRPFEK